MALGERNPANLATTPPPPGEEQAGAIDQCAVEAREVARRRRIASLRRVAGAWATRTDIPSDSLLYERELRKEWR